MQSTSNNDLVISSDNRAFLFYSNKLNKWSYKYFKRFLDLLICIPGFIFLLPFFLILAIAIKLTTPGPVFYQWKIRGRNGKLFTSYKFRTMEVNAERLEKELRQSGKNEMDNVYFKIRNDPRITPIGSFLRKYSIDELPTIWSVLTGQLSLIGPRPVRECEFQELKDWHMLRFLAKPGLTGSWQVNGKNQIKNFDDVVRIDLKYIRNWSLVLDLQIFFKTVNYILSGKNY